MEDRIYRKAQKMRRTLLKLLKKHDIDTVEDHKLAVLVISDPPNGLPRSGCPYSVARKKAWTVTLLNLSLIHI